MTKAFDAIVVGLGAMGSASLYQLSKKGARVLGIDQFDPPHSFGSSHGSTRVIRQAIGEGDEYVPLVLRSYELWREVEKEAGIRLLETTGGLIMAGAESDVVLHGESKFVERTIACARKFGIEHSVLDSAEIRSRFPQFNLAGGETAYYEPAMGFLRPELCIQAQLARAAARGAEIRTNERVLDLASSNGEVHIKTSAGEFTGGKVILSAGPWLNQFIAAALARYFSVYRQVLFWFEVNSVDAYLPGRFPVFMWAFGSRPEDFVYGFPAIDGPAGGIKVASEQHSIRCDPGAVDRQVTAKEIDRMYQLYLRDRLSDITARCVKTAVCLYTSTPDSRFVIDFFPENPNILVVSPCSGHGFKHSAAIGEAVSELITAGRSRIDISRFRFSIDSDRDRRLRAGYIIKLVIGQAMRAPSTVPAIRSVG